MPVFLAQGTTDTTVRPAVTEDYMRSLCKAGSPVRMMAVPKVGHAFIGRDSADEAVD
jgi:dipeptidyl aminopeptidase/acylaminoacyl peptidase